MAREMTERFDGILALMILPIVSLPASSSCFGASSDSLLTVLPSSRWMAPLRPASLSRGDLFPASFLPVRASRWGRTVVVKALYFLAEELMAEVPSNYLEVIFLMR